MMFLRINGSNGAVFFFSTATFGNWRKSLEFYRAVSFSAKCKRALLTAAYPIAKFRAGLSADAAAEIIGSRLHLAAVPAISPECSAMISPTGDKAIIHVHGSGYRKYATGRSLPRVRREADLYRSFAEDPPQSFAVSEAADICETPDGISFFMHYAPGRYTESYPAPEELIDALAEFFRRGRSEQRREWAELYADISAAITPLPHTVPAGSTPVGMVHRDFKPWNIKRGVKPLFFDFEETIPDGIPLADLFNCTVDPELHIGTPETVWQKRDTIFRTAEKLLKKLDIPVTMLPDHWRYYLLERYSFWQSRGETELAGKFLYLYGLAEKENR